MSSSWPSHFTYGHALAFLYISFAHITDDDLAPEELAVIIEKVIEWSDNAEATAAAITEALELWKGTSGEEEQELFAECAALIANSDFNKEAVLQDLIAVAEADGKIAPGEQMLIKTLENAWF